MNILFSLIPKEKVAYIYSDFTVRQALEKMKAYRYTSIPILNHDGNYVGTLSEGDLLWFLREKNLNLEQSEEIQITDVPRNKDNISVQVDANIEDLIDASTKQNFIPVLDDFGAFIGIVTRKDIIYYIMKKCQKN